MAVTRALLGVAAQALAEVSDDVTLAQFRVLVLADAHDGLQMGDLARALGVLPSTATRLCEALENKGFIERRAFPGNRRSVGVHLTKPGRGLVHRSLTRRRCLLDAAVQRLSPAARDRLSQSLEELTDALGEVSDDAWTLGWPAEP
jgi:DNA-binding MarR family transcriptional regulator